MWTRDENVSTDMRYEQVKTKFKKNASVGKNVLLCFRSDTKGYF